MLILLLIVPLVLLLLSRLYVAPNLIRFNRHISLPKGLQIAALKAHPRHNPVLKPGPVNNLPPEILGHIFEFVRVSRHGYTKPRLVLPLTLVCRQWRAVALDHADLWTQFDKSNANWVAEGLKRSKQALLEIHLTPTEEHLIPMFLRQLPRIRRLYLQARARAVLPAEVWLQHAPHLVALHLCDYTFPLDVSLGSCPALQRLELYYCDFTWNMQRSLFPNMVILRIESLRPTFAMDSCLTVLQSMPNLRWLTLNNVIVAHDGNPLALPFVNLHNLATLCLESLLPTAALQFLHRVQFPVEVVSTFVECDWSGINTPDELTHGYQELVELLLQRYRISNSLHIIKREIESESSDRHFQYSANGSDKSFLLGYPRLDPVLGVIPPQNYLLNLRTLVLRVDIRLPSRVWSEVIAPLALLEHLEMSRAIATSFHDHIREQQRTLFKRLPPSSTGASQPTFPSLRILKYLGFPDPHMEYYQLSPGTIHQYMHDFFQLRMYRGRGLRQVILPPKSAGGKRQFTEMVVAFRDVAEEVVVATGEGEGDPTEWSFDAPEGFFDLYQ